MIGWFSWATGFRAASFDWRPHRRTIVRYGLGLLAPVLAAVLAQSLTELVGAERLSFLFLAAVVCAGAGLGTGPAIAAALAAFATYNFYIVEPHYSLRLASANDYDSLLVFLIAAGATGALAGRLRNEAEMSRERLATTQALFEASKRLSTAVDVEEIRRTLAQCVAQALGADAIVLSRAGFAGWMISARGPRNFAGPDANADELARNCTELAEIGASSGVCGNWRIALIQGQNGVHGAVAIAYDGKNRRALDGERILASLAGLGAVALDRSQLIAKMAEAQALAESERLRTALLSSVSHDFRTPLAAILASSTTLLDYGTRLDEAARTELVQSIREESERMNRYVANLLDMTRLEADALKPRLAHIDVSDVAASVVGHLHRRAAARNVELRCRGEANFAIADPVLLEQALMNVVENSITLSPAGARVTIQVSGAESDDAIVEVTDEGPGIPDAALARVFDKFFRVQGQRDRAGVGLGLSIAKGLLEAMGGAIEAESPVAEGCGARFRLRLRKPACMEMNRDAP